MAAAGASAIAEGTAIGIASVAPPWNSRSGSAAVDNGRPRDGQTTLNGTATAYQQDYFQRVRRRTLPIQGMAPLALLVAAWVDAGLTGTPVLSGVRALALPIGIAVLVVLMAVQSRADTIHAHGWWTIALLCSAELALAFIVTPDPDTLYWILPVLMVVPVAAAPFWVWPSRAIVSSLLCYACALTALLRAGPDARSLWVFAGYAALFSCTSLAIFRSIDRLRRSAYEFQVNLDHEAKHDALTGLLSRRRFLQLGEAAHREATGTDAPFSLCFMDLDHFKIINDMHGHAAGDRALSRTAALMLARRPPDALVARMGGEEFVMLLPRADASAAARFADGLREALAQTEMGGFTVSMSAGVAEHLPGEALGETLHRADTALLEAKQRGRNRVEVAPG